MKEMYETDDDSIFANLSYEALHLQVIKATEDTKIE